MNFLVENWYLFAAALVSGGLLIWPILTQGTTAGVKVSTADAVQLINRERAVLIDISEPAQYAAAPAAAARAARHLKPRAACRRTSRCRSSSSARTARGRRARWRC